MTSIRKKHSAAFKAKVALAAIREEGTVPNLRASTAFTRARYMPGRKRHKKGLAGLFEGDRKVARNEVCDKAQLTELHAKIGQLTMERDFFRDRSGP